MLGELWATLDLARGSARATRSFQILWEYVTLLRFWYPLHLGTQPRVCSPPAL